MVNFGCKTYADGVGPQRRWEHNYITCLSSLFSDQEMVTREHVGPRNEMVVHTKMANTCEYTLDG